MTAGLGRCVRMALGLCLLVSTAAACSPPGLAEPEPVPSEQLELGIVRAVDLLKVPGLGTMRRLSPAELPDYQGPELRGACGTVIPQPAGTNNRLAAAFVGDVAAVSEVVVAMDGSDAKELVGNVREKPEDCEPVEAVGSDGQVQTYTPGDLVDIGRVGDDRVATQATLTVDDQRTYLSTILVRSGDTLVHGQIMSDVPIEQETITELAKLFHEASEELENESA
ncbi:MAG TPA: hypothetical protein VHI31_05460 [Actinomycetota bacterium]|nr:hypothetical protein [Actinomycetota bacterium]